MNYYELLYIIPAKYTEDEIKPIQDVLKKLVEDKGGETVFHGLIGRRKLAYPIKKMYHGYFVTHEFSISPEAATTVTAEFKIHPEVLRHQMIARAARNSVAATEAFEKLTRSMAMAETEEERAGQAANEPVRRPARVERARAPLAKPAATLEVATSPKVKSEPTAKKIEELVSEAVAAEKEIMPKASIVPVAGTGKSQETLADESEIDMKEIDKKLDELLAEDLI